MGKLLTGRYGEEPGAESTEISLPDCHQKLGLKPNDFISVGPPDFFKKAYGASGRYLVFRLEPKEVEKAPLWKSGFYLLPLQAAEVLKVFDKNKLRSDDRSALPIELDFEESAVPSDILARARQWAVESQPLFFRCGCPKLLLKVDAPWALRKRWKLRLRCPRRCQPILAALL